MKGCDRVALYSEYYPFVQKPLPYDEDALSPTFDAENLSHHYNDIMGGYFTQLNQLLENYPEFHNVSLERLIMDYMLLPVEIRQSVLSAAGGIYNHSVFFEGLNPNPASAPSSSTLIDEINFSFGSVEQMLEQLQIAAEQVYGVGYAALVKTRRRGLRIITMANEDTAIRINLYPIIQLDIWEHAYYNQYFSRVGDYVRDLMELIDWQVAETRYASDFEFRKSTADVNG